MNVCPAMQRCMQSCYVRLIIASTARVPWQDQHLQSAAPCVSAPQDDAFYRARHAQADHILPSELFRRYTSVTRESTCTTRWLGHADEEGMLSPWFERDKEEQGMFEAKDLVVRKPKVFG